MEIDKTKVNEAIQSDIDLHISSNFKKYEINYINSVNDKLVIETGIGLKFEDCSTSIVHIATYN